MRLVAGVCDAVRYKNQKEYTTYNTGERDTVNLRPLAAQPSCESKVLGPDRHTQVWSG